MDGTDMSDTSPTSPPAGTDDPDATAAYRVTGPPTGGPGGWPTAVPAGEAREVFERIVRETEEPPLRQALRVLLTVVTIAIITVGTIVWQDLDDRVEDNERRTDRLEQRLSELEARP